MRGRPSGRFAILTALCFALATASCGSKPPSIVAVEWRLESRPAIEGAYESLSAFAWISAEDGVDTVWIVNDDSSFAWRLTSEDWIKVPEGSDAWIGGSALASPDFKSLPRGSWRIVAMDSSGQRVERSFTITGNFPDRAAPVARLSSGTFSVSSSWPETLALAYDAAGALVASVATLAAPTIVSELFGPDAASRAVEAAAYGYDPALRMGAFSKRIATR